MQKCSLFPLLLFEMQALDVETTHTVVFETRVTELLHILILLRYFLRLLDEGIHVQIKVLAIRQLVLW